ncbi:MAG: hypothetical protein Q9M36_12965 [Sulfurovum sp.]|nr:hypothetical protein [Sulfurovum sp.]
MRDEGYEVTLLNRSPQRLEKYKADGFETYTFEDFVPKAYDLIINMTSAGLEDEESPCTQSTTRHTHTPNQSLCRCHLWQRNTFSQTCQVL